MRKSRFSPQQIAKILKEFDGGKSVDQISVSYTIVESISEQFDYRKIKSEEFDNWYKNRVSWEGQEPFIELKNNLNFFRVPKTKYEQKEILRKQNFQLKDTIVDLSGESSNVATLIYREKACTYWLNPVIIKIELQSENGIKSTSFLVVDLSYGC